MLDKTHLTAIGSDDDTRSMRLQSPEIGVKKKEEYLPFTVSIVRDESELDKAVNIRHSAYSRHLPTLADTLREAESYDREPGAVVILAESKLDGSPLGSIRIHTNRYRKLNLEKAVAFPYPLNESSMAHASRLGIEQGRVGLVVKTTLFKAYYLLCMQEKIDWMVIAARSPLDRQYEELQFQDINPGTGFFPLPSADGIPHRVMCLKVANVEPGWRESGHKLYNYFFRTYHPDIDVSAAESALRDGAVDQQDTTRIMGLKA
jgi:hypothetical protein